MQVRTGGWMRRSGRLMLALKGGAVAALLLLSGMPAVRADYADGLKKYFQEQVDALKADGKVKTDKVDWDKVLRKDVLAAAKKLEK